MSLVKAVANVLVGYGVTVVTQILVFPVFGRQTTLAQNMAMGALFTGVSIVRSYTLRRLFEALRSGGRAAPRGGRGRRRATASSAGQ